MGNAHLMITSDNEAFSLI